MVPSRSSAWADGVPGSAWYMTRTWPSAPATISFSRCDGRRRLARFSADAATANQAITDTVRKIAEATGVAAGQVAIAWAAAQGARLGIPVVPIPGTKRVKWIEENAAALDVQLTDGDLAALEPLATQVIGARY